MKAVETDALEIAEAASHILQEWEVEFLKAFATN